MDISYDWLGRYVEHGLDPDELAEELTTLGLEVDGTETVGQSFDHVVVGEVLEVRSHPDADRLVLCRVEVGEDDPRQIACGAPNVAAGQRVPVALEGATVRMPDDGDPPSYTTITVDRRTIRGEESAGMICAEDELGLSEDHSGIMVLDEEAEIGRPFERYLRERGLPPRDTVYDIDLTPNRPDAASHIGVARDVAARTETELVRPEAPEEPTGSEVEEEIDVEIEDAAGCRRYVARMVRDVSVGESPAWLQHRLRSIGLEPRNNVVDVTNFVLHECGQPLHAFDLDRLADRTVRVRSVREETEFVTLDGVERTLPKESLVIADGRGPVAVAGIMGGRNTEVDPATTDVLLESAYFDPARIRRTAGALGLSTDSSYRFERGVDPRGQRWAAHRAAHLIAELAGGSVVPGTVDAHPNPVEPTVVSLRPQRVRDVLGARVTDATSRLSLERLGFTVESAGEDTEEDEERSAVGDADTEPLPSVSETGDTTRWRVTVPTFRPDVDREVDLIEEIARLVGYDRIPERGHSRIPNQVPARDRDRRLRTQIRRRLAGLGFREIYTNSMLKEEVARRFTDPVLSTAETEDEIVETLNPISEEMAALRPSLVPGMLEVMAHNAHHGQETLRFFEFGRVFRSTDEVTGDATGTGTGGPSGERPSRETSDPRVPGYDESADLLIGLTGPANRGGWDREAESSDFFDLKGVVEHLLEALRLDNTRTETYSAPTPLSAYRLELYADDRLLGSVARLARDLAGEYDLERPVLVAQFREDVLFEAAVPPWERTYDPIHRYPRVDRDLDVVVPDDRRVGELIGTIREAGAPLLRDVDVFDLYEGDHIEDGFKSVGFSLQFGSDHTLVDEEVDERIDAILDRLDRDHDAHLRQ